MMMEEDMEDMQVFCLLIPSAWKKACTLFGSAHRCRCGTTIVTHVTEPACPPCTNRWAPLMNRRKLTVYSPGWAKKQQMPAPPTPPPPQSNMDDDDVDEDVEDPDKENEDEDQEEQVA